MFFSCVLQEYVLQADGTVTPLSSVQNYVLSEQQAGEILAQVRQTDEARQTVQLENILHLIDAVALSFQQNMNMKKSALG